MNQRAAIALFTFSIGCVADAPLLDGRDDSFTGDAKADTAGIVDGSPEALAILELVNQATLETLLDDVGLASGAANNIVAYRLGDDELAGSADDEQFDNLAELDAVPFVGPVAFRTLLAYLGRGPVVCDAPDVDRYIEELPEAFAAQLAPVCVPASVVDVRGVRVELCQDQRCEDGTPGCPLDLRPTRVQVARWDGTIDDFAETPVEIDALHTETALNGGTRLRAQVTPLDGVPSVCVAAVSWRSSHQNYIHLGGADGVLEPISVFRGTTGTGATAIGCETPELDEALGEAFRTTAAAAVDPALRAAFGSVALSCR